MSAPDADPDGGTEVGMSVLQVSLPMPTAHTTEAGGEVSFLVSLPHAPSAPVTVPLTSSAPTEGKVTPASLTFTALNWNAPQTVTVSGVDDVSKDGDQGYDIQVGPASSTDPSLEGLAGPSVRLTNLDDESAGLIVSVASNPTSEAGVMATFTVALQSQPRAGVSVAVSSDDPGEGAVTPTAVTFTAENWNSPQTVNVMGVDDADADGEQAYTATLGPITSADVDYAALAPGHVALQNVDNDSAGVSVLAAQGISTSEAGATAKIGVVLNSRPSAAVTMAVSSSDLGEGVVAPAGLTFTPVNWNAPQMVTVTGVDDAAADGNQMFKVVIGAVTSDDAAYAGLDPADVTVINNDDDSAGVTVTPPSGLVVTEAGGSATFTVALNSEPTANVIIGLSSGDPSEGMVAPSSVTFTPVNWRAPQTVTVTGLDDREADGSQPFSVWTAPVVSADLVYVGLDPPNVTVSNTDDDSAGITVTPTSGLVTSEAQGTAAFTVVLNSRPAAAVTIALGSDNPGEGTVDPASLIFTPANWDAPQAVTVTGVNDDVADGNQLFTAVTGPAMSLDPGYAGLDPANVTVSNTDNDSAGVTVAAAAGLATSEAGGTATFAVVLNSAPIANVVIALASSDASEASVGPASLTFTPANWNAPQTATVTGLDDALADGNQPYAIVTAAASSNDGNYDGLDPVDVSLTNTDNDSAGITVTPTGGLATTEAGGTASFAVVLNSEPTANVVIAVSSGDLREGTVGPASLTFTPANWDAPQTVTVTGANDDVADGNQPFVITTAAAISSDAGYAGLDPANVSVTNTDNDSAGITVSAASGLTTTEFGGTAIFTVVLNSEPTANVVIAVGSNDSSEGTAGPASLTFTASNWSAPQTVTVTGVNDNVADGNQPYAIVTAAAASADAAYAGLDPANVPLTNTDNDSAGITVTPTALAGLTTTEAGGTATFTVVLNSEPTSNVVIGISSGDVHEGSVGPASLTFTALNWNAPQTVTVTGVNDNVADGNQPYSIVTAAASSSDGNYAGMNPANVSVTNTDNDSAGITVAAASGLTTSEAGASATFTVVLNSEPTANVVIGVTSGDTGEGTAGPASLTFTALNWNAPQIVTVTGVNDDVADGSQLYTIVTAAAVSADGNYAGLNPANVTVSNTDNDSAGITVTPTAGLTSTEAAGTATFTVVLNSEPTANVVIGVSSGDVSEGTVSPTSLTFTALNWNAPQTVTVTGVDDNVADGNQPYTILTAAATSGDGHYAGLNAADVAVSNTDNDSAGFTVTPTSGLVTTEGLATATFTVVLNSEPTADVVVGVSSNDTSEGTVSSASLTFTAMNWNAPQTVTVTGVNDNVADGNQPYTILTAAATSGDGHYAGLDPDNVGVSNTDNDSAGFTVTPTSGLITTEGLATATFTVVLNSEPTANVVVGISSSDTSEGTVSAASLTFTAGDWNIAQTVTVTGVNDNVADGNQPYTILTGAATSADGAYSGVNPDNVSISNTDNDSAGFTVTPTSGLITTEALTTATFTVVLNSEPTADVVVGISSSDTSEGKVGLVEPISLTFMSTNWNMAQTVTVTGVNDNVADGNQPYTILTAAATSADPGYSGLNPDNVSVSNTDNDGVGFTVSLISRPTTEAGGTAIFTLRLNSEPTADVVIGLTSNDTTEGTVSPASLTFTAMNWNMDQTVTVTGVDDALADGAISYSIVTAAASSSDSGYNGQNPPDVSVSNSDNEPMYMFKAGNHNGNLGGRAGANAWCTSAATGLAVGKTIRAFISLSDTDEIRDMPSNYGVSTSAPIKNLAGTITIAADWADLLNGPLVSLQAAGVTSSFWHSFTTTDGVVTADHCTNGTLSTGLATAGQYGGTDSTWFVAGTGSCGTARPILCLAF